jgi:hypothetical protein
MMRSHDSLGLSISLPVLDVSNVWALAAAIVIIIPVNGIANENNPVYISGQHRFLRGREVTS